MHKKANGQHCIVGCTGATGAQLSAFVRQYAHYLNCKLDNVRKHGLDFCHVKASCVESACTDSLTPSLTPSFITHGEKSMQLIPNQKKNNLPSFPNLSLVVSKPVG